MNKVDDKFEKFIMCGGKEPRDFNIFGDILISTNSMQEISAHT